MESYGEWYAAEMNRVGNQLATESGEPVMDDGNYHEAVDLKQLRDPAGFVDGIDQFIQDTRTDIERLNHFASTYAQSPKADPSTKRVASGVRISLGGVDRSLDKVEDGLEQLKAGEKKVGGKVIPLPGVKGQRDVQKNPGLLKKLFGMK